MADRIDMGEFKKVTAQGITTSNQGWNEQPTGDLNGSYSQVLDYLTWAMNSRGNAVEKAKHFDMAISALKAQYGQEVTTYYLQNFVNCKNKAMKVKYVVDMSKEYCPNRRISNKHRSFDLLMPTSEYLGIQANLLDLTKGLDVAKEAREDKLAKIQQDNLDDLAESEKIRQEKAIVLTCPCCKTEQVRLPLTPTWEDNRNEELAYGCYQEVIKRFNEGKPICWKCVKEAEEQPWNAEGLNQLVTEMKALETCKVTIEEVCNRARKNKDLVSKDKVRAILNSTFLEMGYKAKMVTQDNEILVNFE